MEYTRVFNSKLSKELEAHVSRVSQKSNSGSGINRLRRRANSLSTVTGDQKVPAENCLWTFGNGKECPIRGKRERMRLNNPPQQNWSELGQNESKPRDRDRPSVIPEKQHCMLQTFESRLTLENAKVVPGDS